MEAVLNQLNGFDSSDPAGYQLGEVWNAAITVENTGNVDVGSYTLHKEIQADDYTLGEDVSHGLIGAGETVDEYDHSPVGQITEKDVERGYIEVIASVKWTDPASGEERTVSSAVWNKPVISKTGLVLTKKAAPPPNGEYYLPGEEITWTLKVTNNGGEPIRNVTVTDNGEVIATFGEIGAGETRNCPVPPTPVTEYYAQVTGGVVNIAKATGSYITGGSHTWYSNPAFAVCMDPEHPVMEAHPALTAVKNDLGPANGAFYEENEEITFQVTVTNTGDCELNDLVFYDSLAGLLPVDTLASLPPADSHTFTYQYSVKASDMDHPLLTNHALITFMYHGYPGIPVSCERTVKIGGGTENKQTPSFDPDMLPKDEDCCSLTLDRLGAESTSGTLHACGSHSAAAAEAEAAGLAGDWKTVCAIWRASCTAISRRS